MSAETSPLVIDVHTHPTLQCWERAYAAANLPRTNGRPVQETVLLPEWRPEISLATMDRHGIQAMMMSNPAGCQIARGAAARELARAMNEEMAAIVRHAPARFGAFATLPTDDIAASVDEMTYALDALGLDGIHLPTNIGGAYLGDEQFAPLWAECDKRKTVVFVHPLAPGFFDQIPLPYHPSLLEYMFDSARMLTSMVFSGMRRRFPDFTLISTHAGGVMPFIASRIVSSASAFGVGNGRKMEPDLVWEGLQSFHFDVTTSANPAALGALLELVPTSRIMFGTDFPIRPEHFVAPALAGVAESKLLDAAQRRDIQSGTALTVLPRLAKAIAGT